MGNQECIWDVRFEICISYEGGGTEKAVGYALLISGLIVAGDVNLGIVSVKVQGRKHKSLQRFSSGRDFTQRIGYLQNHQTAEGEEVRRLLGFRDTLLTARL